MHWPENIKEARSLYTFKIKVMLYDISLLMFIGLIFVLFYINYNVSCVRIYEIVL